MMWPHFRLCSNATAVVNVGPAESQSKDQETGVNTSQPETVVKVATMMPPQTAQTEVPLSVAALRARMHKLRNMS